MLRACTVCAALSDQSTCPRHRGRKRNGSTRAWRVARAAVLERDGHRCRYCGKPATTVDHVIPVAAGGSDDADNLLASCRPCNAAKGDVMPTKSAAGLGSTGGFAAPQAYGPPRRTTPEHSRTPCEENAARWGRV